MKRLITGTLAAFAALGAWAAGERPSYSLAAPTAPVLRLTSDAAENVWLASNRVYAAAACWAATPTGTVAVSSATIAGNAVVRLDDCEAGFAFERVKPEVWLGGALVAPAGTDWAKTYEAYQESAGEQQAFIFDPQGQRVYAQAGGTYAFTWVLADGTRQTRNYVVSSVGEGRPYRMFWTDDPYNAPPVNMSGRTIRLFGPSEIITPVYGTQVVDQNGQRVTNENVIVSGVFLDTASSCLYARGKVTGQFLVAFYDSGSYDTLQRVQVVEVGSPDVNYMKGYVGEKIEPYGTGYDTSGLYPSPVSLGSDANDASGPYYYQHKGTYSYSPKNNWVYPLRTTEGEAWRLDVYWMETDPHGIAWPFERCNYTCSWNTNRVTTLIAGAPVRLPTDYAVTLGGFQEPEGHARAPEGGIFRTQGEGFSLLKLSGQDNVWFVPVRSVVRTDTNFFTLAEREWLVGDELRPRGGSARDTPEGYAPPIDVTVPGLLNLAESGDNYNPNLYYNWTAESNVLASVIYAVNATPVGAKPLEVWWSTTVRQEGMPTPVSFPALVQRYRIAWPAPDQVPQIVLASQQGGTGLTRYETGACAQLDGAAAALALPDVYAFHPTGGAVSFWGNAETLAASGRVLALGTGGGAPLTLDVSAELDAAAGTVAYRLSLADDDGAGTSALTTPALSTDSWHKVVFSFAASNATVFVDGAPAGSATLGRTSFGGFLTGNRLGGDGAAAGLLLDDVALWSRPFDANAASNGLYAVLAGDETALSCAYTFAGDDLQPTFGARPRTATDCVSGRSFAARDVLRASPGAPVLGTGVFAADETPVVYRQPDRAAAGYNPNEEHAFIASGAGGYYAWALRCDLNEADTSRPFVLAQYVKDGRAAMRAFSVILTNEFHTALAADVVAGKALPGPHPIDLLDNPWCTNVYWDAVEGQPYASAFRDRKGQVWARAAGTIPIRMYYRNQDGFDYPCLSAAPPVNAEIPWLSELEDAPDAALLANAPAVWTWRVTWPSGVPTMRIGETLTTAANGLPEVWNAKSLAVVWPQGETDTVKLWDPTVARESGSAAYATAADLLAAFGFSVEAGNVTLRAGKYTFKDLPPSIGDRFYVDNSKPAATCVTLIGRQETNAGGTILWPNVANRAEIAALKGLPPESLGASERQAWAAIVDGLALARPVLPTEVTDAHDPAVRYVPRDHYALTAMGATGFVTVVENDAPVGSGVGQLGVSEGDAVSLHVFAVTNRYYAGRVIAREDPLNLLSQQLAILYTESFAGTADDYEFEWKKATPTASGAMPTDYANAYARAFSDPNEMRGLTRFTIGQQGDSLANLVNTFYVMRYRAVGGAAKATMGDTWSDWCGPTLAEGWLQRVVDNVTPFTQRMTDLYENRAETASSMIQAAGGPYRGDVALSQDNLADVGLIQLYQTLLNKAESMSIASGAEGAGVNDSEVNKQLLLATERLADLYMVLGNDAYADALNPTIGFGTGWGAASPGLTQIDYGAASPGLFCFDNQVPTLLDEELALLRGRTGANNPSVRTAPFYNRLVWNFTRGITAGEVAYAVNYNVNSSNGDATIDENDAALQYPQGHGDAWGHYLSALSAYYRLLRNPNFTWPVSQSQMLVSDAVVDVDYYDESRFAEIANRLAVTAAAVADRTARKAWRDNGGANGAGFLDDDADRNFGYGEWATRGAIGGIANWMVANAILPEPETADAQSRLVFGPDTYLSNTNLPLAASADLAHGWTFEFQVAAPTNSPNLGAGRVLSLVGSYSDDRLAVGRPVQADEDAVAGLLTLEATGDGRAALSAANLVHYVVPVTNYVTVVETNANGAIVTTPNVKAVDYADCADVETLVEVSDIPLPDGALVALDRTMAGETTLRVLDARGSSLARIDLGRELRCVRPTAVFGGGFAGALGEIRGWLGARSDADLQGARAYVNPREPTLAFYTRGTTRRTTDTTLADETPGGDCPWRVFAPQWAQVAESGLSLAFSDKGLLRIDRTTVTDLAEMPASVAAIQRTLDRLDAGLNPLGLSDAAVPFDIASTGVAEGTSTHFEQVAARAETALGNAAKLLDRAQEASTYLRQVQNATSAEEELAATSEADSEAQLIALYGTPYSGDIGPGKMYEQGYTGPDLYHYMYMDLSGYGLTSLDDVQAKYVIAYSPSADRDKAWSFGEMKDYAQDKGHTHSNELVYFVSANGLVVKPASVTGSRTTSGRLQQAFADYLLAYVDVKNAVAAYNTARDLLVGACDTAVATRDAHHVLYGYAVELRVLTAANELQKAITQSSLNSLELIKDTSDAGYATALNSTPSVIGAGLTCVFSPQYAVNLTLGNADTVVKGTIGSAKVVLQTIQAAADAAVNELANIRDGAADTAAWTDAQNATWDMLYDAVRQVRTAATGVSTAVAKLNSLVAAFDTLVAEGDRLQAARAAVRAKRVNRIVKLRYNDMLFRRMQDAALSRYSAAFDLAQRQVFMAAQAYDYETVQLTADREAGDAFKAEIVGARALGTFGSDGRPQLGLAYGDAGLSDILARMEANYQVLKPRLGISNADANATWFSLRRELFRIDGTDAGLADWQKELEKHLVGDLRDVPEYSRFCQPVAASGGLAVREPALVIPFETTIDFGKNLFGHDLAPGDHALDSSYYATKIRSVGVRFENYNAALVAGTSGALAATPVVYLVPVGTDRMRVPGDLDGRVVDRPVVDQVIPVPYAIGSTALDDIDFAALASGYAGVAEPGARIRRIPSFRAMTGSADDADRANTRLIGRSAWNTRWLLIIPAGQMRGGSDENRRAALDIFIHGADTDHDGRLDVSPVTDILLGLRTYSTSGN